MSCDGNHPGRGPSSGPYTAGQCRVCWLSRHAPDYRVLWGPGPLQVAPCLHRGEAVREQLCPTCCGHVRLKVFACAVHGECTVGKALAGLACCSDCSEYDAGSPPAESASGGPAATD